MSVMFSRAPGSLGVINVSYVRNAGSEPGCERGRVNVVIPAPASPTILPVSLLGRKGGLVQQCSLWRDYRPVWLPFPFHCWNSSQPSFPFHCWSVLSTEYTVDVSPGLLAA